MSKSSLRLIRAVRILPEVVRIGHSKEDNLFLSDSLPGNSSLLVDGKEETYDQSLLLEESENTCKSLELELSELRERQVLMEKDLRARENAWNSERKTIEARVDQEMEKAHEQGFSKGHKEGYDTGLEEGKEVLCARVTQEKEEEVAGIVALLNTIHEELRTNLETLLDENSHRLILLWQKVLSKILVKEVSIDSDSALRLLKNLLANASDRENVRVYLHPEDIDYVKEKKKTLGDVIRSVRNIEFVPDNEVDRGSCLVETGLGTYDARWRTQLGQIGKELDEVLSEGCGNEN